MVAISIVYRTFTGYSKAPRLCHCVLYMPQAGTRFYIQHSETGDYLKVAGVWTSKVEEGLFFSTYQTAKAYCERYEMEKVRFIKDPPNTLERK